jgi:gamma-glutamylcyclotransferase
MTAKTPTFRYFAYGSNMLGRRLRARTPSATAKGIGYLSGRRLTFDKVSADGSGKCDIEPTPYPTDRVYGVVFEIPAGEKAALDTAEGLCKGYREERVTVITSSGNVDAAAYVATAKEPALCPYHWYKALVIAGATEHALPGPYVEWLRTVESKPDPKATRRAENEALLYGS